jgi:hypothetical protein
VLFRSYPPQNFVALAGSSPNGILLNMRLETLAKALDQAQLPLR